MTFYLIVKSFYVHYVFSECLKGCKTCLPDGLTCTSCLEDYFLQGDKCLPACISGFHTTSTNVCHGTVKWLLLGNHLGSNALAFL